MEPSILTNLKESEETTAEKGDSPPGEPKQKRRRFYIFLDYSNFLGSLESEERLFEELKSLENEILRVGTIEFADAYIPHHRFNEAPVLYLSNVLDYTLIGCSLQTPGGVLKRADTVDAKMERKIWAMMYNADEISDFVIISGDADFEPGTIWVSRHQKKVLVLSGKRNLSARYRQLEGLNNISVKEV